MHLLARLEAPGPKRLLSLDGGGIRGVLAAEILVRIEEIVRARNPRVTCLADWFDFVGGTSTGAILAAGVAMGLPAATLRDFYLDRGPRLFRKTFFSRLWHRYDPAPLARELRGVFGDRNLGSEDLRTLLLVVAKNATTGQTWFFTNNPRSRFHPLDRDRRLWQLVLASSAAPTFFPPVPLDVAPPGRPSEPNEFVDGGMSMFNNPSLRLFLEATHPAWGVGWPRGEKNLLLVSVGTGYRPPRIPAGEAARTTVLGWAGHAIEVLMEDANLEQNLLLRMVGATRRRAALDEELGAHGGPPADAVPLPSGGALLTYHRYTTSLSRARFAALGLGDGYDPERLAHLDAGDRVAELAAVGRAVAREQVSESDFADFL